MRIIAIIQARMKSTRLPGKVLKEIVGIPVIEHLLKRLSHVKSIDKNVVATSSDKSNVPLCQYLELINCEYFIGSEDDVLERYYQCASLYDPQYVLRLTSDCPLIDPNVIEKVIDSFIKQKADYACTDQTFAEGLDAEIFSFKMLEEAFNEATLKSEREHVSLFFHNNKSRYKIIKVLNDRDDSKYRFTIDDEEDFIVVKKIFETLYSPNNIFYMDDIIAYLDSHPEIYDLNKHIIRNEGLIKSLKNDGKFIK